MSPSARQAEYVTYEWSFALGAGVRLIPLELEKTELHPRLRVLQRINFTNKARPWERLMASENEGVQIQHQLVDHDH